MKARLLLDQEQINPAYDAQERARVELSGGKYAQPTVIVLPAGTIIDDPKAALLVRMGSAEPADEECAAAVSDMTPAETEYARKTYAKLNAGMLVDPQSMKPQ